MKKIILLILVCIFCIGCNSKSRNFTITDCIEDGVCKQGLNIFIDNEEVTITKDYCIQNNKHWDDKNMTCWIR